MLSWSQRFFHPVPLLFHALRQGVLRSPHRLILPAKLHSQCFFQNDMLRPEFLDTVSLSCHPEAFLPTASHDFLLPLQWCQSHSHQCGWTHILHSSRHRILLPHILTPQTCSPWCWFPVLKWCTVCLLNLSSEWMHTNMSAAIYLIIVSGSVFSVQSVYLIQPSSFSLYLSSFRCPYRLSQYRKWCYICK